MAQTANQALADLQVAHAVGAMRYSETQVKQIYRLLQQASIDLERQIYAASTAIGKERLTRLLGAVDRYTQQLTKDLYGHQVKNLKDFGQLQASVALHDLESIAHGLGISLSTPNFGNIAAAAITRPMRGKLLKDWWQEWGAGTRAAVEQQIRLGVVENESIDSIVRRIRGTRAKNYKDGLVQGVKYRHAAALARTSVSHMANHAHQAVWEANADIIEKIQWLSTLDSNTTPICQARDGETYPVKSGPRPPAHIGCRSTTVPVLKSWKELGLNDPGPRTRASMNGQVAGDMDYQSWLKRMAQKDPGLVRQILGARKAALFMKGGLTVKQFVNMKTGVPWDLAYLKAKHPKAWAKAFGTNVKKPKPRGPVVGAQPPKPKVDPRAQMAAWKERQRRLKAKKKEKKLPETLNLGKHQIATDRLLEIGKTIPGAKAQFSQLQAFLSKHQTGSIFGLASHMTKQGFQKFSLKVETYIKGLGKPAGSHPLQWIPKYMGVSDTAVLGWTGQIWNTVMIRVKQSTAANLAHIDGKRFPRLAERALGRYKASEGRSRFWNYSDMALTMQNNKTMVEGSDIWLTWLHEQGHQVYFRAQAAGLQGRIPTHFPRVTRYSATNDDEWFAEHFSLWVLNRKAFAAAYPEAVEYIEKALELAMKG